MRTALALLLAAWLSAARAQGGPAFADVPPCHWAAEAVQRLAGTGIFIGFPPDDAYLSTNALRQVFEGLRCGDHAWSLRFIDGGPEALREPGLPDLEGFELEVQPAFIEAGRARLAFALTAVIDGRTEVREGVVDVRRTDAGWQVAYADLAALDLPIFPR